MPQSYTNLLYHIVFSTRNRQPLIAPEYQPRLYDYIGGTVRRQGGISLAINGTADHIHLLLKLRPDKAVSDVLRDLKANASGWLHELFPALRDFSWQNGYGAFTVSASQVERVRAYIANQEQHHRRHSFRDELIALLKANTMEFDERFL
ncbi:MAG TPA: IS200/IS605 family transposase [Pyrinomonadaceae bacterium]|jgi:REP element-mobilizing transposase RayT